MLFAFLNVFNYGQLLFFISLEVYISNNLRGAKQNYVKVKDIHP